MPLTITSGAFGNQSPIPDRHSKKSGNILPHLAWSGVPDDPRIRVLIVDDPRRAQRLVHALDRLRNELLYHRTSGNQPQSGELTNGSRQGVNGFGETGYGGPQPRSGERRYFFHLYALATDTEISPGLTRQEINGEIRAT
jgi:phosphatidylethanolamine-binding protein (PEBP) family uncharacterized protein